VLHGTPEFPDGAQHRHLSWRRDADPVSNAGASVETIQPSADQSQPDQQDQLSTRLWKIERTP
jgi:hypothetical protein